jgi:hypothetical protein
VTHTLGCGAAGDGQRTFWLVEGITGDDGSLTLIVKAIEIGVELAYGEVEAVWGTYQPGDNGNGSGENGSGAGGSGTGGSGNGGSGGNTSGGTCGKPPSSIIDGLPAAACGDDFDRTLDNYYGYLSFDDAEAYADAIEDLVPGDTDTNEADYNDDNESDDGDDDDDDDDSAKRHRLLKKRGFFSFFAKAADVGYISNDRGPKD